MVCFDSSTFLPVFMLKHHKFISFCLGLCFVVVMQRFAQPIPIFRFLLPAFLAYAGLVLIYNRWYLKKLQKYNVWILVKTFLLLAAAFGIFLNIPSVGIRGLFLIFTVLIITLFEIILSNSAENILLNEILIIAFGIFFSLFGAYWYVPAYEPLYSIGIFLGVGLLVRVFYETSPLSEKAKIASAIIMGLFCSELFWVLNFLHFHFSFLTIILFNLFYFCLIINYYYIFQTLNFKKIKFHLFLIACCSMLVLLATPWSVIQ